MRHKLIFFVMVLGSLFLPCAFALGAPALKPISATAAAVAAAPAAAARGALYRIVHNGNTSYLFGTVHVGKPAFYPLGAAATQAFAHATKLVLEVDIGNGASIQSAMQKYGMYAANDTIKNHLAPVTLEQLKLALVHANIALASVQQMKPWLLANLLLELDLRSQGYETALGVDAFLLASARQQAKAVQQLESADYQFSLFAGMSAAQQERYLRETLTEIKAGNNVQDTEELMQAWSAADAGAQERMLRKTINDKTFTAEFTRRVLLDRRNPELARSIEGLLKNDKASFVGLGLLHLIGDKSVPMLLRQRGYAVERLH